MFENTQLVAKAALISEQIDDRISRGATAIEIQLLDEFLVDKKINLDIIKDIDVVAVHMPLTKGEDFPIEYLEGRNYFKQTCKLANKIGVLKNHKVIVVVHITTSVSELKKTGLLDVIKITILKELNKYDNIIIALENPSSFSYQKQKNLVFNSSVSINEGHISLANVELAKHINHERCGVCLDVCHALMDEHNLAWIDTYFDYLMLDTIGKNNRLFDEIFNQCKPYLKLIHLSYSEHHGYGKYHGLPYVKYSHDDKPFNIMKHIQQLYSSIETKPPITIEVCEHNVNHAINFTKTMSFIKNL